MKNLLFIVLLGLVFYFDANSQIDSIPVRFAGRVESVDSTFQLPYVHVINKRTGLGVITDSVGIFKTTLFKADTLIFRCLGFNEFYFNLPDTLSSNYFFVNITMSPTTYKIKVVDVYALTPRRQFKYDFINMPVDESGWQNQDIYIPGVSNPNYKKLREAEPSIYPTYVGGPLGFVYKMTKRSKSFAELERLVKEDKLLALTADKYSIDLLGEFSGLTGDTLQAFYMYLNFSAEHIYKTNEYDLYLEILRKTPGFEKDVSENGIHLDWLKSDSVKMNAVIRNIKE